MDQKQLSYEALRSVLGHMEANKRIQISIACPSLRKVEKTIPLKIEHLNFESDYEVQINTKLYRFGIIREYREGTNPEPIQTANNRGGITCDLDEWGFERPSYGYVETPGDISFGDLPEVTEDDASEGYKIWTERRVQEFRGRCSRNSPAGNEEEEKSYAWMCAEFKLLPFRCRENNVKPAHDCFVQLNVETIGEFREPFKPVQKVPYTKKLHEVMKGFMTCIFGGRSCLVQVDCLEVYSNTQIIRLPVGIKFNVHQLRARRIVPAIFKCLLPVLDESCLPIKHINQETTNDLDLEDPFVTDAEEFTFHNAFGLDLFEFILNLPHSKVNFFQKYYPYDSGKIIAFIENLLESEKKVGTRYQFAFDNDKEAMDIFNSIKDTLKDRVIVDEEHLIIKRKNSTDEIHISCGKDFKYMYLGKIESFCVFKIEVVDSQETKNH